MGLYAVKMNKSINLIADLISNDNDLSADRTK